MIVRFMAHGDFLFLYPPAQLAAGVLALGAVYRPGAPAGSGHGDPVLCLCADSFHRFVTQVQWEAVVADHRPELFTGFAVSENVIRLIVLLHAPVLKCDALHTERRLDDGVVNGAELLLLGQRDTLYRFAGIELVYAPSALAESV